MVANTFMRVFGAGLLLVTLTSIEAGAAQSVVFVSDRTGDKEIWRMDSDGTGLLQLTFNPGLDAEPVPSPDGRHIAFISEADNPEPGPGENPNSDLWVMNADGSALLRLTNYSTDYVHQPAWSPDGNEITFVRMDGIWCLERVPADGSQPPTAVECGVARFNPEYRPTSEGLLYDKDDVGAGWWSQVYRDAQGEHYCTSFHHSVGGGFSHDGQRIAYIRVLRNVSQVRVMDVCGANDHLLIDNAALAYDGWGQGTWSPDDTKIAVSVYPSLYPGVPQFDSFVQVLDATTGDEIHRTSQGRNTFALESGFYNDRHFVAANMVWSSDGSKLVFMSDRDGNWEIYTMNVDGTEQVNLTNTDAWDGDPVWIQPWCVDDADCNDGLFCNGVETCVDGSCEPGADPCPGQSCDEAADACDAGAIPAVSEWGLIVMTLLLLTGLKVKFGRSRPVQL